MVPNPSRRSTLHVVGAVLTGGLAGCAGIGGSSDPDAGTDSYGLLAENAVDEAHDVQLLAKTYEEEEVVLDETVTLATDESREWDELLTGDRRFLVEASLTHEHFDGRYASDRTSVKVGDENSPAASNVAVTVAAKELDGFDHPIHAITVSL